MGDRGRQERPREERVCKAKANTSCLMSAAGVCPAHNVTGAVAARPWRLHAGAGAALARCMNAGSPHRPMNLSATRILTLNCRIASQGRMSEAPATDMAAAVAGGAADTGLHFHSKQVTPHRLHYHLEALGSDPASPDTQQPRRHVVLTEQRPRHPLVQSSQTPLDVHARLHTDRLPTGALEGAAPPTCARRAAACRCCTPLLCPAPP